MVTTSKCTITTAFEAYLGNCGGQEAGGSWRWVSWHLKSNRNHSSRADSGMPKDHLELNSQKGTSGTPAMLGTDADYSAGLSSCAETTQALSVATLHAPGGRGRTDMGDSF